jgi:hypothetical protein
MKGLNPPEPLPAFFGATGRAAGPAARRADLKTSGLPN